MADARSYSAMYDNGLVFYGNLLWIFSLSLRCVGFLSGGDGRRRQPFARRRLIAARFSDWNSAMPRVLPCSGDRLLFLLVVHFALMNVNKNRRGNGNRFDARAAECLMLRRNHSFMFRWHNFELLWYVFVPLDRSNWRSNYYHLNLLFSLHV